MNQSFFSTLGKYDLSRTWSRYYSISVDMKTDGLKRVSSSVENRGQCRKKGVVNKREETCLFIISECQQMHCCC